MFEKRTYDWLSRRSTRYSTTHHTLAVRCLHFANCATVQRLTLRT